MRRNEGHCPCGECKPFEKYDPTAGKGIRDCPATEQELALLAKARRTTDPRKLAEMVPAWVKRELTPMPKPWQFVPDKAPVYPAWTRGTPNLDPHGHYQFPHAETTAEYVRAFDEANNLKGQIMKQRFRYYKGVRYIAPWKLAPVEFARCGQCGRAWDDKKSTGITPTPAGRCPFEYWHKS